MTNASILDRNICDAFEAYREAAPVIEDAFWRFRNAHDSFCAERLALLNGNAFALTVIAARVCLPMLPSHDPANDWRVRIELDDFMRERLHHFAAACTCSKQGEARRIAEGG